MWQDETFVECCQEIYIHAIVSSPSLIIIQQSNVKSLTLIRLCLSIVYSWHSGDLSLWRAFEMWLSKNYHKSRQSLDSFVMFHLNTNNLSSVSEWDKWSELLYWSSTTWNWFLIVYNCPKFTQVSFICVSCHRRTNRQTNQQTDQQINKQTDTQTDWQTDRYTDKNTDTQKNSCIV